ncbi:MAG: hypothetical protein H7Y27_11360 [Gemmatimonadaceae bacterium]|nr:hypothetical protein [Chitinophagaceae bacterium]
MSDVQEHIKRINEKLQILLKQYQLQLKENEKLKKQLNDVREMDSEKTRQLEELEQKVSILKTATNNLNEEDKKELERRINQYVKEIDRCIAMLAE